MCYLRPSLWPCSHWWQNTYYTVEIFIETRPYSPDWVKAPCVAWNTWLSASQCRNYRLLSKFEASLSYIRPCLREGEREEKSKVPLFYKPGLSFSFLSAVNNTPDSRDMGESMYKACFCHRVSQSNDQIRTVPAIPLKHIQICPGKMGKVTPTSQKYTSVTVTAWPIMFKMT